MTCAFKEECCPPPHSLQGREWCKRRLCMHLTSLLGVTRLCVGLQAHAGFAGSPDADTNPTFTQVASNIAINNWSLTVTLPPVSLSVISF